MNNAIVTISQQSRAAYKPVIYKRFGNWNVLINPAGTSHATICGKFEVACTYAKECLAKYDNKAPKIKLKKEGRNCGKTFHLSHVGGTVAYFSGSMMG